MAKRYLVFLSTVCLALSLAVPALGGPGNPIADISASAMTTAKSALKTAKAAQASAKKAQKTANAAQAAASGGQTTANGAKAAAEGALTAANDAKTAATDAGSKATAAQGTADAAKTAAANAQSSADTAKAAADAAQSTANAADANANGRFKTTHSVQNTAAGGAIAGVACDTGRVTGGGFVVAGTDPNAGKVTVTLSSDYGNGWLVISKAISGTGAAGWDTTADAICATTS